jgi:SAM-dependent methyltransferase
LGGNLVSARSILKAITPGPVRRAYYRARVRLTGKYDSELRFWRGRFAADQGRFSNSHYERLMLAMAEEPNDRFLKGKIVGDFGCGPRGSLAWARSALLRLGIDVLVDRYADEFTDNLVSHGMVYVKSTESVIPIPTGYVDVMFTLNAMDHVDDFPAMCCEIVRVIKPGGLFVGSFNLHEPPSKCEPQTLSEQVIRDHLLDRLEVISYRITEMGPPEDQYGAFFRGELSYQAGRKGFLWVKARKRG